MSPHQTALSVLAVAALSGQALAGVTTSTGFESGRDGWVISGRETINPSGGNPGASLGEPMFDVFGADIRNNENPAVLGDLSRYGAVEFHVDVKVHSIDFFGTPVDRDIVVQLRDIDEGGLSFSSVWFNLGTLTNPVADRGDGWFTYSVTLTDMLSETLPAGWHGSGDEDPITFEPVLPRGRTFASVIQNVDEIAFTTLVPGFFYGFSNFDIEVDNVGFTVVPAPSTAVLLAGAGMVGIRRRR